MKRKFGLAFWLAISTVAGITVLAACNKTETASSANNDAGPSVSKVFPEQGADGAAIVLKGAHFAADAGENQVFFGDIPAEVLEATDSTLTVIIPRKATTGEVKVSVGDKTTTALNNFVIDPKAAVITSFAPKKVKSGDTVTISGKGFTNSSKVFFGDTEAAELTVVDANTLSVIVPAKAGRGKLRVVNGQSTAISSFDVSFFPRIDNVSTLSAEEGAEIVITGEFFSNVREENIVSFGPFEAQVTPEEFISHSNTELRVKAPKAGKDGTIAVTVGQGADKYRETFTYLTTVTDFYPKTGTLQIPVTIKGRKLPAAAKIKVNGQLCTVSASSDTACTFMMKSNMVVFDGTFTCEVNGVDRIVPGGTYAVKGGWGNRNAYQAPKASLLSAPTFVLENRAFFIVNNKDVYIYDVVANSWSVGGPLPAEFNGKQNIVAIGTNTNRAYVGLGDNSTMWYSYSGYDNNNPWIRVTDCPVKGGGGTAFFAQGRVFVIQGTNPYIFPDTTAMHMYNTLFDNRWSFIRNVPASMPNKNALHFVLNGIAYIFGGEHCTVSGCVPSNRLNSFNYQGRMFAEYGPTPGGNRSNSSTFVINEKAYLNSRGSTYAYNVSTDRWSLLTHPDSRMRAETIASYVMNGKVIGFDAAGRVYEYRPS